jgi:hypothetical protein
MTIRALLNAAQAGLREPTLSYELFPPRSPAAEATLLETMKLASIRSAPRYEGSSPFGAMREAHAHGTPMNGKAYLLTLRSNGSTVVRVFTTNTTYTPDDEAWSKLKTAKSIEAVLATATYDQNNILQGSGPFVAPGVAFTIE